MKTQSKMLGAGLGVLILAAIPFTGTAQGATKGQTFYTASFKWSNGTRPGKTLRILIARSKKHGYHDPMLIAKIMDGQHIEAICSIQNIESYSHGEVLLASSVDMSCKGTALGALAAPATVYFSDANAGSTSRNRPVLRFGTWLQGYEQAVLTTEFDQSARLLKAFGNKQRKEMVRPTAQPVKLARAQ